MLSCVVRRVLDIVAGLGSAFFVFCTIRLLVVTRFRTYLRAGGGEAAPRRGRVSGADGADGADGAAGRRRHPVVSWPARAAGGALMFQKLEHFTTPPLER